MGGVYRETALMGERGLKRGSTESNTVVRRCHGDEKDESAPLWLIITRASPLTTNAE